MSVNVLKTRARWTPVACCFLIAGFAGAAVASNPNTADDELPENPTFNRHIRPILSDSCYKCHGPDSTQRKTDLRFDTKAGLFEKRGDHSIIVPGKPGKSELYRRIASKDPFVHMPPPDSGRTISPRQVALIKRWIKQGAKWEPHWAFIPPKRPPVPELSDGSRVVNPIDAFILDRLKQEGLQPSPEAKKTTLIRRLTLDLTGLPPTPDEVDAFLADDSPNAYEKLVDRLLKSPRFGEKMAVHWLDAARYADTSGYQNDGPRYMWRWRDWVVNAFNANKPYDEFVVEQLAGDMLPNPTLQQQIATAFNRNHRGNAEGGVVPEEFQVEYVVDRVETTFTVVQGLTMGCARCHEHKFDPLSQKDFYRVFAYFNNIPEYGRAIKEGNSPPYIKAPTKDQQKQLRQLSRQLATAKKRFRTLQPKIAAAQQRWEQRFDDTNRNVNWTVTEGLIAHFPLDGDPVNRVKPANRKSRRPETAGGGRSSSTSGGRQTADSSRDNPTPRFENAREAYAAGRFRQSAALDGQRFINAGDMGDFGYFDKFSCGAWVYPAGKRNGTILSRMTDVPRGDGYALALKDGKIRLNLVKRWLDDSIRVETKRPIPANQWTHVFATYDGSRVAEGIRIYVNGKPVELVVKHDFLNQSMKVKEPLRIGAGGGPKNRFRGQIDEVRVYDRHLSSAEVEIIAVPESISDILQIAESKRTPAQRRKLRAYYLAEHAPTAVQRAHQQLVQLRRRKQTFVENLPTVMVMQEMDTPRTTHLLKRGEYNKPGPRVFPGIPESLAPDLKTQPQNRLEFARWMVSDGNPLTARVAVNRFWQMLFGVGIVKTAEDFGTQGERPSHPELLDWLAVEFRESDWNVKRMIKTIVMSATYRQSSDVQARRLHPAGPGGTLPAGLQRDPENRLLGHGPRFRMPAEMIRDQALFLAGLLTERLGGPSVRPYQPKGLWKEIATDGHYEQSHGPDLYRRSLYTYWKRTVAPPVMTAFDAPAREFCRVRRARTNTPLQALALLNDVTFVEAARKFAERIMLEGGDTPAERIIYAFRLATSRQPTPEELRILTNGFEAHREKYRRNPKAAEKLVSIGESSRDKTFDVSELAAYTATTSLILNLDEVMTKE